MTTQERETQNARRHPWLWDAVSDARGAVRDTVLVSLFVNLLALATPVFVLQVYDRVVFHAGLKTLQGLVLGMALVVVFDYVLRRSRSRIFQSIGLRIDVAVGRRLFDKILGLPLRVLVGDRRRIGKRCFATSTWSATPSRVRRRRWPWICRSPSSSSP